MSMKHVNVFWHGISFFILLVSLMGIFPLSGEAKIGESLEFTNKHPLTITAERLTYLANQHLFVAEGHVEITYRKARLTADYIEFHEISGDAVARGHVLYEEEGETASAAEARFNFDHEQGIITAGNLALKDDQYIAGEEIIKTGAKTYTIKNGTFTACENCQHPAWKFWSSTAKIHEGQYLQAWNTVGFVKGIPIFYFPYFIYPIKTERQTGFLIPKVGRSTLNGYKLGNAFFWAISPTQDATLYHTYYEKRGHKIDLEYRYKYSVDTEGVFTGQYVHQDKLDLQTKKRLKWNHHQGLPYAIKGLVNLDLTSDEQFDQDFSNVLDERSKTSLRSNASFTKNFSQHAFKLLFDRLDDLRSETDNQQVQRLPEFSFSSQQQQVFGTPLYFSQRSEAAYLKRRGKPEEYLDFARLDIHPTLSLPFNVLGSALTITPRAELRETFYSRDARTATDSKLDAKPAHREYYSTSVNMSGPKFNRIFDFGGERRTQKLKHLIEPSLSFRYTPVIENDDLPKFDGIDQVGNKAQKRVLQYALTQRLLTKRVKRKAWDTFLNDKQDELFVEDLATETKELASLVLNQSYDFEREEYQFSNINSTLEIRPFDGYDFRFRTAYDPYVNTIGSLRLDVEGRLTKTFTFKLGWRKSWSLDRKKKTSQETSQYFDIKTNLVLFRRLGLSYRGRFNVKEQTRIEDNIGVTYNGQCWSVFSNFTQQLVGKKHDNGFHILLELKHIGKLLDLKG